MDKPLNVLLVGEEAAGVQTLRAVASSGHRIVAVVASPTKKALGGMTLWNVAAKLGYATWPAKLVKDPNFAETIRSEKVDILLNIHSLFIIHPEVLKVPRIGSFNMHPAPLPRYAGLNAVSWAIYRGERTHGVTIHQMVPEIDAGPIVYQAFFDIEMDTALSLTAKCTQAGVRLVQRLLETAAADPKAIPRLPQDLTKREYFGTEIPENGRLSWSRSARDVVNFVRACDLFPFRSPWGYPRARIGEREIALVKACLSGRRGTVPGTVGQRVGSALHVACADEWILVQKLICEGHYLDSAEVLKPGDRLDDGH